jgi:integrase
MGVSEMASIEKVQRKDGTTGHRVRYRDHRNKSQSQTFDRLVDARALKKSVEADVMRGEYIDPRLGRMSFKVWADHWLASRANIKNGTRARYATVMDHHLIPVFGDMQLSQITPVDVQVWIASMRLQLPASGVRRNYGQLSSMLKAAVKAELIVKTPCTSEPPKAQKREMRFLSVVEVEQLAAAINPLYRTLIYVMAYAGPRWGEAVGLRRRHIDTLRRTIRIEEQLTETDGVIAESQSLKSSAGVRTVSMPTFLATMIDDHLLDLEARRAAKGLSPLGPNDYLFLNRDLMPLRRSAFRTNHWLPALAGAQLGSAMVHDLRHTAVSFAINLSHAHPKAVQVRFGHSSIQQTYDRYGHLFPQMDGLIADALDLAYEGRSKGQKLAPIVDIAT